MSVRYLLVPPSDAGIQGPVEHKVWKSSEAPNDMHGHEYMHTMLQMKMLLTRVCMEHALRKPWAAYGSAMFNKFYEYFCEAFVNPQIMDNPDAVIYKEKLMTALTAYNVEIERTGRIPYMIGPSPWMDLAWNPGTKQLEFPTVEKMLVSDWIMTPTDVISRMAEICFPTQAQAKAQTD
jgi:hypothetical protein